MIWGKNLALEYHVLYKLLSSQFVKHVEKISSLFRGHMYIYINLNILFRKEDGFDTYSLKEKAYQGREILSARDIMLTY
jgi:hypothetical protein